MSNTSCIIETNVPLGYTKSGPQLIIRMSANSADNIKKISNAFLIKSEPQHIFIIIPVVKRIAKELGETLDVSVQGSLLSPTYHLAKFTLWLMDKVYNIVGDERYRHQYHIEVFDNE